MSETETAICAFDDWSVWLNALMQVTWVQCCRPTTARVAAELQLHKGLATDSLTLWLLREIAQRVMCQTVSWPNAATSQRVCWLSSNCLEARNSPAYSPPWNGNLPFFFTLMIFFLTTNKTKYNMLTTQGLKSSSFPSLHIQVLTVVTYWQ